MLFSVVGVADSVKAVCDPVPLNRSTLWVPAWLSAVAADAAEAVALFAEAVALFAESVADDAAAVALAAAPLISDVVGPISNAVASELKARTVLPVMTVGRVGSNDPV